MAEATGRVEDRQETRWWTVADVFTFSRIPLAVAFVLVGATPARLVILVVAALTDFVDGYVARRWGSSRLGSFLDPVADKLFMAGAFGVVLASGALNPLEIVALLARDIAATIAFVVTAVFKRPSAIPARLGGKVVTIGQLLTMLAFVLGSSYLRPLAWATAAVALYAIWDYTRVARSHHQAL
ncbi:MAG: CDP-alcohol phosphatidyltransferase family protein [Gemmatimonadota bacterium]